MSRRAHPAGVNRPPTPLVRRPPLLVLLGALCASALALPATADAATTGFLAAPANQIAVPGMICGAEITPEGDLFTRLGRVRAALRQAAESVESPTALSPDPAVPLLCSTLADGSVLYTQTLFAIAVRGQPVAYETVTATNRSARPHKAQVAMLVAYTRGHQIRGARGQPTGAFRYERPVNGGQPGVYDQPGQANRRGSHTASPDAIWSGRACFVLGGPAAPSTPLRTPAGDGPRRRIRPTVYRAALPPGGKVSFTCRSRWTRLRPALAPAPTARSTTCLRARAGRATRMWDAEEAGMMEIGVPEAKVRATYRAAIVEMLESRLQTPGAGATPTTL